VNGDIPVFLEWTYPNSLGSILVSSENEEYIQQVLQFGGACELWPA
jgi:hypothetical protein